MKIYKNETKKSIVSACLAGFNCRYDGKNKSNKKIITLVKNGKAIPICPEILAGLPTPRPPTEIKKGKVVDKNGNDYTDTYKKGAQEATRIAKLFNCQKALLLNEGSPSCGVTKVYDGNFRGKLIKGKGVFAKELQKQGIKIQGI